MVDRVSGSWSVGTAACGTLLTASLVPGAGNSGKLVSLLKEEAGKLAEQRPVAWLLCDGPPGTGCPTMAALAGSDALLAVAEPSASGLHDFRRLLDLAAHFGIAAYACINKADLAPVFAWGVREECQRRKVPLLAEIPYDPEVSDCARRGEPVVNREHSPAAVALTALAERLAEILEPDRVAVAPLSK
jgi:MinD superfamily P-loop ATPase